MLGQQVGVARFNAQTDHPAAGVFHQGQQLGVHVLGPHGAVERHLHRMVNHALAEVHHALAIERELIVVEIDMSNAEPLAEKPQMPHEVFGGVVTEGAAKHRTVTVAALIGTTPAGDATRVGRLGIVEDRQLVLLGKALEFVIAR